MSQVNRPPKNRRTVCFGGEGPNSAQRYFRADIPAKALGALGWRTETSNYPLFPVSERDLKEYGPYIRGWNGPGTDMAAPRRPCTIVTLRIMDDVVIDPETERAATNYRMENMARDIIRARDAGQVVLYDIDDDIWNIPDWSPAAHAMHSLAPNTRACDTDVVDANIRACDGVMVSTPHIQGVVAARFPDIPVYLMRPGIDSSVYLPRTTGHPLRVGWMGSMDFHLPHLRTMQAALDVLPPAGAEFMRIGWIGTDDSEVLLRELPCTVGQIPWGPIRDLPQKLTNIDIGIIPRVPSLFNEGQSITSGLQYAAAGIPFLVSPSEEYVRLETLGAGRVCRSIPDWRQALSDLLENSTYRTDEAERARECVESRFGLRATGLAYDELFGGILDGR